MPTFNLRSWRTQTLYDCKDYMVEAETLDGATELLLALQYEVDQLDQHDAVVHHDCVTTAEPGRVSGVTALDPQEIIDGDCGISELDAAGNPVGGA
jgi:hypothetical protein